MQPQPYLDARLAGRPQSKFGQLTASEFAAGLARMRLAAEQETCPAEVCERYDVLAFATRPDSPSADKTVLRQGARSGTPS
jgi:hypothetical protein